MSRRLAIILFSVILMLSMTVPVMADEQCQHTWVFQYADYEEYSNTQHKVTNHYECDKCYETKSDVQLQNHRWEEDTHKYDFAEKSSGKHSYKRMLSCKDCYHSHEDTFTENHNFNRYNECKDCDYILAGTITLKPGKTAYVNRKSWVKIKVSKKGYLAVKVKKGKGGRDPYENRWSIYDSKKRVYMDHEWQYGNDYVPVKKGTYYIRTYHANTVEYSFKKDPSKKNFTQKRAYKLKKKKTVKGVVYPSDSQKTWTRYYKVKLTKKQFLHFKYKSTSDDGFVGIRDSKGNGFGFESMPDAKGNYNNTYTSSEKLKKGTYYIVVSKEYTSASRKRNAGFVYSLKWY